MRKLPLKTRFFNFIRTVFKLIMFEKVLLSLLKLEIGYTLFSKLVPNNYQYNKNTIRVATRNGVRYRLDISEYIDHIIYFHLKVESKSALYKLVKDDSIIFDIGSNIGETLLTFSVLNKSGEIHGFEPVPLLYDKATRNLELNETPNVTLHNLALSDLEGALYFELPTNHNFGSTTMQKVETDNSIEVKSLTLDKFVQSEGIKKIDLIKMDVEGFEHNVIRGGIEVLKSLKPTLFLEVDSMLLENQGTSASLLIQELQNLDYTVYFDDLTEVTIDEISVPNHDHFDIICFPNKEEDKD